MADQAEDSSVHRTDIAVLPNPAFYDQGGATGAARRHPPRYGLRPRARARRTEWTSMPRWLIPASRLSAVDRNPSRALRVASGDGLRPSLTEPGRESPDVGSYR
jgi:hypothetical protein